MPRMICDFHMHSLFSDGDLLPSEIVRRVRVLGHRAIAITDHVDMSNLEFVTSSLVRASEQVSMHIENFQLLPGVEITHVPPSAIPEIAKMAKRLGAKIVVVHGETPVEPVEAGTNEISCSCMDVDILAHPGIISEEAVISAKKNGIFLELSFRGGHCLGNGHVAALARKNGALLLVDSDAHTIGDHLTTVDALKVAIGAGLKKAEAERVVFCNPDLLLKKVANN